ncbi:MAG: type II toxin-antitoxin system VapC family toxin [Gammaproteobacteria bacterium]
MIQYLDTSLLVAALTNEAHTAHVQRWLASEPPMELAVSEWGVVEFSSALALKSRTRQLGAAHRASALAAFTRLCNESLDVLDVRSRDFRTAERFVNQYAAGLRSGDALQLGIAANRGARLWTLDKAMTKAGVALGLNVQLL